MLWVDLVNNLPLPSRKGKIKKGKYRWRPPKYIIYGIPISTKNIKITKIHCFSKKITTSAYKTSAPHQKPFYPIKNTLCHF